MREGHEYEATITHCVIGGMGRCGRQGIPDARVAGHFWAGGADRSRGRPDDRAGAAVFGRPDPIRAGRAVLFVRRAGDTAGGNGRDVHAATRGPRQFTAGGPRQFTAGVSAAACAYISADGRCAS